MYSADFSLAKPQMIQMGQTGECIRWYRRYRATVYWEMSKVGLLWLMSGAHFGDCKRFLKANGSMLRRWMSRKAILSPIRTPANVSFRIVTWIRSVRHQCSLPVYMNVQSEKWWRQLKEVEVADVNDHLEKFHSCMETLGLNSLVAYLHISFSAVQMQCCGHAELVTNGKRMAE